MTKEQIEEFSKKLSADGNEFIMLVLCDGDLVTQMDGTYFGLSVFLAAAALNDDTFKQVQPMREFESERLSTWLYLVNTTKELNKLAHRVLTKSQIKQYKIKQL